MMDALELPPTAVLLLAAAALGGTALYCQFFYPVRCIATAEQRRKLLPQGASRAHLPPGPKPVKDEELREVSGFYQLKKATVNGVEGQRLFHTSLTPADGKVECVFAFVHGYQNHHRWSLMNIMRFYCVQHRAHVIGFDMPGHGLSDGHAVDLRDWHEFVGAAEEIVEALALPQCTALAPAPDRPLPLFAQGVSMGGGVVASLALRRPELLSGMILEAPMLYVSDDLKPPKIVLSLFRHVIIKIPGLVTWPVAPSKDIEERCFSDPEILLFERSNPLNFRSKPRLGSCV